MACVKCNHKGYIETFIYRDAGMKPMVAQCPNCRDTAAYSRRVQLMLQTPEEAFKSLGREEPFIGNEMNVTYKGVELKGVRESNRGEPCPVIPLRKT